MSQDLCRGHLPPTLHKPLMAIIKAYNGARKTPGHALEEKPVGRQEGPGRDITPTQPLPLAMEEAI